MDFDAPPPPPKANVPGGPGSQWRMMRLRRVYETAEEEGLPIEQVAVDRFGSLDAFEEAREERRILDEREGRRGDRGRSSDRSRDNDGETRFMFNDLPGSGSLSRRSSFRRPVGVADRDSAPSTPSPSTNAPPMNRRLDSLRLPSQAASPLQQAHTPIPTVMTPSKPSGSTQRALSPSSLNKLQAKVLRAKLMGSSDAAQLEREYEAAARQGDDGNGDSPRTRVEVLPTLDGRGRLYDVGHGGADEEVRPGNRKKKEKVILFALACLGTLTDRLAFSLKLAIQKRATLYVTMRMMIPLLSVRCCGKKDLAAVVPTRKIWTPSLHKPSWEMANSKYVLPSASCACIYDGSVLE